MKNSVLIVTSEFPPLPGGIGNHAVNLACQLKSNGYDVTVLTDQRSASLQADEDFDSGLPVTVIRIKRQSLLILTYLNRIKKTFSLVNTHNIIIASGKFPAWLVAIISRFFISRKFVGVLHGSELGAGGKAGRLLMRWSLKQYHKLIAVSNFTRQLALERRADVDVHVINNGFAPKAKNAVIQKEIADPSLITVGSVTMRKGQQNVIQALPHLKKSFPGITYHVVGLPTEQNKFSELARQLNVEREVIFYGVLPDEALHDKLTASSVFCMLSDHLSNGDVEGFGIAVLEANHLGLPAIGSRNSGIADAIRDGFSGKLVDPHDPQAIQIALAEILDNYPSYSRQAREWAAHFDWSTIVQQYIRVISQ